MVVGRTGQHSRLTVDLWGAELAMNRPCSDVFIVAHGVPGWHVLRHTPARAVLTLHNHRW